MANGTDNQVVVIGGGIGGLAAALRLRHAGWDVTLLEKNATLGGRCNILIDKGFTWDIGPSLFFMTHVFRELFTDLGRRLEDYLTLHRMEPNYVMRFADGETLTISSHMPRLMAELERIEPGVSARFMRYLSDASVKYRLGMENFVQRDFRTLRQFLTKDNVAALGKSGALGNYYRHICRVFRDDRLRAAFSFQTIYLGDSPLRSPAVYHLLPYTELVEDGLWYAEGGTYSLVRAMESVAREMGVTIRTGAAVRRVRVENGAVSGVEMEGGGFVPASVVVSNADLPTTYRTLLPPESRDITPQALDRRKYTAGAFTMYLGLDVPAESLGHHTIFFPKSFLHCLRDIYTRGVIPDDPAFYVSKTCASDPSLAPPGGANLFVLVPTPHLGAGTDWSVERARLRERMLDILEQRAGVTDIRRHIVAQHVYDPTDWRDQFALDKGAAFGLSHGIFQVGYFRPDIASRKTRGLYFVGASTRPGTGVPLVLIGARLVARRIQEDRRGIFAA